jgi:hypothetical protein
VASAAEHDNETCESAPGKLLRYLDSRLGKGALPDVAVLGLRDATHLHLPEAEKSRGLVPIYLAAGSAILGPVVAEGSRSLRAGNVWPCGGSAYAPHRNVMRSSVGGSCGRRLPRHT